jgi:hypothetical protein
MREVALVATTLLSGVLLCSVKGVDEWHTVELSARRRIGDVDHTLGTARSADVMGLTDFDVRRRRNVSELTGLRNNIVTSQKKLFLMHKSSLFSQLMNLPDRSDYIVLFDLSDEEEPIIVEHYHDQFTCPTQRKWFEDFRSSGKVVCKFRKREGTMNLVHGSLFSSQVLSLMLMLLVPRYRRIPGVLTPQHRNHGRRSTPKQEDAEVFHGKSEEEGDVNMISLFAKFPISLPRHGLACWEEKAAGVVHQYN